MMLSSTVVSYNIEMSKLYNSIMLSYNVDIGWMLYNLLLYSGNAIQGTTVLTYETAAEMMFLSIFGM